MFYPETICHPVPNAAYSVMRCAAEACSDSRGGVLSHSFAAHGCHKETIESLLFAVSRSNFTAKV